MIKISDELRKRAKTDYIAKRYGEDKWLSHLADRIDAEMVALPCDADGKPIHIGDMVYDNDGEEFCVDSICLFASSIQTVCGQSDGKVRTIMASDLTHKRPDSLERIADEIEKADVDGCTDWADRIRKLAKEGEHE